MSLVINTGEKLELYARKPPFYSNCSATASEYKLLNSLNISGNKPFQWLQNRNFILILYYVLVSLKKKIFKFVHWNCQLPQSTGNCKPMICEKMNTVVLSVLKIMFSLRYLADCVSRFTELGFYFPKGKENQSPLSICFNTFFFFRL